MKHVQRVAINLIILLLVACLPSMIKGQHVSISSYFSSVIETLQQLLHPANITFVNKRSMTEYSIFPFVIEPWLNTMIILFSALLLSFLFALLLVFLMYRFKKMERIITSINNVLSIIPDIFYVPLSITSVIIIYKSTGHLLFEIATSQDSNAIVFPILVLLVIPLVNSVTLLHRLMQEERESIYVEFARAKGLTPAEVFFKHIVSNLAAGYMTNLKHITWITLSSLLFLERILNIYGLSVFIFDYSSPVVLFTAFIMLYVPLSAFYAAANTIAYKMTGRAVS